MSNRTSKIWGWRQRFVYRLNDVVAILWVLALVATLIIHGFIKMRLSVSKTMAIMNSDDMGDAPEPFHVLKYMFYPEEGSPVFKGYLGCKVKSMSQWPITEKDGIVSANMKLALLKKDVGIETLPPKFRKGPLLISMLAWSSFIKIEPPTYNDPYLLELLVATDNCPSTPLQRKSLSEESINIIETYSKRPHAWIQDEWPAEESMEPIATLKAHLHDLGHASMSENERFQKLDWAIILINEHQLSLDPCRDDRELSVLQELLDNGLEFFRVPNEDKSKVKAMNLAADELNFNLLARLNVRQQSDHIYKKHVYGYSEDDMCLLGAFLKVRPELFESLAARRWKLTHEMVGNYLRSGATRKPVFFDEPVFRENIPLLVSGHQDIALRLVNKRRLDGRPDYLKLFLSEAEKLSDLPIKITRLSALKLIERARRKDCFYSLAQLKRMDINAVLDAALTPDQYTFIRKTLMAGSENVDLSKLPDSVLEDVCMEELGL